MTEHSNNYLPIEVVNERICEFEEKYDLLKYQVDGWSVWPLLRSAVVSRLVNLPRRKVPDKWKFRKKLLDTTINLYKIFFLQEADYLVVTNNSSLSEQVEEGLYKDIFFDDLLPALNNYVKIEHINNPLFLERSKHAFIKSNLTTSLFSTLPILLSKISFPNNLSEISNTISYMIISQFSDIVFDPEDMTKRLRRFYWAKKFYKFFFLNFKFKKILLTSAYSHYDMIAAAKEVKIKSIEFQHGTITKNHVGYSWSSYAKHYKTNMPIPDKILLYGEHWKEELLKTGFWQKELIVVGSLRVDHYRNKRKFIKSDDVCTILVTTQNVDVDRMLLFLTEFLEIAESKIDILLYIKLHPLEPSKEIYNMALGGRENVIISTSDELPSTFTLLVSADFHVSIYSTCHFEALALGVPTVILPLTGHENVLFLTEEENVFIADSPIRFLDIILYRDISQLPSSREYGQSYFRPGALKHTLNALDL